LPSWEPYCFCRLVCLGTDVPRFRSGLGAEPITESNVRVWPAAGESSDAPTVVGECSDPLQKMMPSLWKCPKCQRMFSRQNQRHACGTGERSAVLRGRPEDIVALYVSAEAFARSLGPIEIVARERYVLFRSTRIFADFVLMSDALRAAIHLGRRVEHPIFFKVATDRKRVSHVAKLRTQAELISLKPYLREAYELSVSDLPKPG
jgi:hypothetical protein